MADASSKQPGVRHVSADSESPVTLAASSAVSLGEQRGEGTSASLAQFRRALLALKGAASSSAAKLLHTFGDLHDVVLAHVCGGVRRDSGDSTDTLSQTSSHEFNSILMDAGVEADLVAILSKRSDDADVCRTSLMLLHRLATLDVSTVALPDGKPPSLPVYRCPGRPGSGSQHCKLNVARFASSVAEAAVPVVLLHCTDAVLYQHGAQLLEMLTRVPSASEHIRRCGVQDVVVAGIMQHCVQPAGAALGAACELLLHYVDGDLAPKAVAAGMIGVLAELLMKQRERSDNGLFAISNTVNALAAMLCDSGSELLGDWRDVADAVSPGPAMVQFQAAGGIESIVAATMRLLAVETLPTVGSDHDAASASADGSTATTSTATVAARALSLPRMDAVLESTHSAVLENLCIMAEMCLRGPAEHYAAASERFAAAGGCEAVVSYLQRHSDSSQAVHRACVLLAALAQCRVATVLQPLAELRACEVVLDAWTRCGSDHIGVGAAAACDALAALCAHEGIAKSLMSGTAAAAVAVSALHSALRQFTTGRRLVAAGAASAADRRDIVGHCKQAIAAFRLLLQLLPISVETSESPEATSMTRFLAKSSLVPTLLAAIKLQSNSMERCLAFHAADCIATLAYSHGLAHRFISVGVCDELVAALQFCAQLNNDAPDTTVEMQLLRSALGAMNVLERKADAVDLAVVEASGAVEALVAVLQAHGLASASAGTSESKPFTLSRVVTVCSCLDRLLQHMEPHTFEKYHDDLHVRIGRLLLAVIQLHGEHANVAATACGAMCSYLGMLMTPSRLTIADLQATIAWQSTRAAVLKELLHNGLDDALAACLHVHCSVRATTINIGAAAHNLCACLSKVGLSVQPLVRAGFAEALLAGLAQHIADPWAAALLSNSLLLLINERIVENAFLDVLPLPPGDCRWPTESLTERMAIALLSALGAHGNDVCVTPIALQGLGRLLDCRLHLVPRLLRAGAAELVCRAGQQSIRGRSTCDFAARCIHLLASFEPAAEVSLLLLDAQALHFLANAVEAHPADDNIALSACFTLRQLAAEPLARLTMTEADGLRTAARILTTALTTHSSEPLVVAVACGAIRNICAFPAGRTALMHACGTGASLPSLLTQAARNTVNDSDAAFAACGAAFSLACEPAYRAGLAASGVASLALQAIARHPADAEIAWAACGILVKLAAADGQLEQLQQRDGAGAALVAALQSHPKDGRVVRAATAAISRLAGVAANRASLVEQGAADALAAAAEQVGDSALSLRCRSTAAALLT